MYQQTFSSIVYGSNCNVQDWLSNDKINPFAHQFGVHHVYDPQKLY